MRIAILAALSLSLVGMSPSVVPVTVTPTVAFILVGPTPASVVVTPASVALLIGGNVQLSAVGYTASGSIAHGVKFTWTSSNNSVATVKGGLVTAVGVGSTVITASASGKQATCAVSVTALTPLPPPPPPPPIDTGSLKDIATARGMTIGVDLKTDWGQMGADTTIYRTTIATNYNLVSPRSAFSIASTHYGPTTWDWVNAERTMAFVAAHPGMAVDGHILIWESWLPSWIATGAFTKTALLDIEKDYITTVLTKYPTVRQWAVVNEAIKWDGTCCESGKWYDTIGPEYIDSAFVWAHRASPNAFLYINDYSVEGTNAKSDGLLAFASALKSKGVPINGVGFQDHAFPAYYPVPASMQANLARFIAAGFTVKITEFDFLQSNTAPNWITQAVGFRDALNVCLNLYPGCDEFTSWGGVDKWQAVQFAGYGRATAIDSAYAKKPALDSLVARMGR